MLGLAAGVVFENAGNAANNSICQNASVQVLLSRACVSLSQTPAAFQLNSVFAESELAADDCKPGAAACHRVYPCIPLSRESEMVYEEGEEVLSPGIQVAVHASKFRTTGGKGSLLHPLPPADRAGQPVPLCGSVYCAPQ